MGLLAFPQMLKAGYNIQVSAGSVTAGGCLGILIPPSVLLIVYGATAGVSVVQLYAGAFFPGFMLALLYVGYRHRAGEAEARAHAAAGRERAARRAADRCPGACAAPAQRLRRAAPRRSAARPGVPARTVWAQLFITLLPLLFIGGLLFTMYRASTAPVVVDEHRRAAADGRRARRDRNLGDQRA